MRIHTLQRKTRASLGNFHLQKWPGQFPGVNARSWAGLGEARPAQSSLSAGALCYRASANFNVSTWKIGPIRVLELNELMCVAHLALSEHVRKGRLYVRCLAHRRCWVMWLFQLLPGPLPRDHLCSWCEVEGHKASGRQ